MNDILHDDRRATEIIQRMRSLLKKAPFEQKQFDLNEVVQETTRFVSALGGVDTYRSHKMIAARVTTAR